MKGAFENALLRSQESRKDMKTLGILGGMGPAAGAYFYERVVANTLSDGDAGHLRTLLLAEPGIPDRTAHLLGRGESPLAYLKACIVALRDFGAEVVAIPCNTAHAYLDSLSGIEGIILPNMPRLAASYAASQGARTLGLLSTRGTLKAGVYRAAADTAGLRLLQLPAAMAEEAEELIYRQKTGEMIGSEAYMPYIRWLFSGGADTVLLACTEISVAFRYTKLPRVIDALEILAKNAISLCGARLRGEKEKDEVLRTVAG